MNRGQRLPGQGLIDESPLFEMACLVARARFGAKEADRVRAILGAGEFDWSAFFAFVARHYVTPLANRNLGSLGSDVVPPKVLETLRVRARINEWKAHRFATELVRLNRLFESHSIETIHYKGAVAGEQYYGAVALRTFGDLDFLLRRKDVVPMVRLLQSDGYVISGEFTPEQFNHFVAEFKEFLFRRGDFALEPHWSVAGRRYPFDVPYEGLWERATMLRFDGAQVRVLGPEDAVLVLCLVGAKGRWKRLQMVTDVAECVRTFPKLDWASVERTAKESGTLRILRLGLTLAESLVGATLPDSVARNLRDAAVDRLAADVVRAMIEPPPERRFLPDTPSIFSPLLFRQRERASDRWSYFWHTTTTPSPLHMQRMPLPRWLSPLYRLLVPLHDYVAIPLGRLIKREIGGAESDDLVQSRSEQRASEQAKPVASRPKQSDTAVVQRMNDDVMVLERKSEVVHNLNVTAAWIFDQCDGQTDEQQIVDRLMHEFSVDRDVAERDVAATLRELKARGLVRLDV